MLWSYGEAPVPAGDGGTAVSRRLAARPGERLSRRIAARLALWRERYRGRRALAGLDEERLCDIGLTVLDVRRETAKPFWRA